MKNLRRVLARISLFLSQLHVGYLGWLYFIHLKIRYLHDTTYAKGGIYKKWTDKPYSRSVHRTVLVAFILSFTILTAAQGLFPFLFNIGKPQEVQAGANTKVWTTRGDFNTGTTKTGSPIISGTLDADDANVKLNPAGMAWTTATSLTGAPEGRAGHTAVWTGETGNPATANRMIIWGGENCCDEFENNWALNTGGIYNPATNTWSATSITNAPLARYGHSAVWTGSKMIIWGGTGGGNTGGIYDPATNSWTATSITNAPSARSGFTAVWTGSKMIIWGGAGSAIYNDGGLYDPVSDTWTATSITNAPTARTRHTAVWTGSKMIIWGGNAGTSFDSRTGIYDPATNSWIISLITGQPSGRHGHTAIWTGSKMIIWGGDNDTWGENAIYISNTGGIYDPVADTWVATSVTNVPVASTLHVGHWTGTGMIIWGGTANLSGGFWVPNGTNGCGVAEGCWSAILGTGGHGGTSVWTGSEMIMWGGAYNDNSGKRYSTAYASPASISALYDSHTSKSRFTKGTIALSAPLPANTSVTMAVRAGDTTTTRDAASFYDLANVVPLTNTDSKCTALSTAVSRSCYSGDVVGAGGVALFGLEAEAKITLASSDGNNTPIVDGISLISDSIDNPQNLAVKRNDTSAAIPAGGWTNETTVKVTADAITCTNCVSSTNPRLQIEIKTGVFDGAGLIEDGGAGDSDGVLNGSISVSGLSLAAYKVRARGIDNEGRVSDWINYNSGNTAFSIEQTPPTGTVLINNGATYATSTNVTLNLSAADTGGSGLADMRFSNDGTTWSAWEPYAAAKAWTMSSGDGTKTVYAQFRDNAGNVSGQIWTSQNDFNGTTQGAATTFSGLDLTTTDGSVQLAVAGELPNYGTGAQGDVTIAVGTTVNINTLIAGYNGTTIVPNFNNLTINGTLTTSAGVPLVFKVKGTLNFGASGTINANYLGSSGGFAGYGGSKGSAGSGTVGGIAGVWFGADPSFGCGGTTTAGGGGYYGSTSLTALGAGGGGGGGNYDCYLDLNYFGGSGGSGGGAILATINNLGNQGTIYANGGGGGNGETASSGGGGGSGGSIYIILGSSTSSVNLANYSAVGGAGGSPSGVNGGGGRITLSSGLPTTGAVSIGTGTGNYAGLYTAVTPYPTIATLGATGTGLRYGDAAGTDKPKWVNLHWSASGLSATNKIGIKVRAADAYGSGNYVNPSDNTATFYYLTSGTSGDIPISTSIVATKTIEVQLELDGDGYSTPVLNDLAVQSGTPASIILDATLPQLAAGTITAPVGGENWGGGTTHNLTWDSTKITDAGSGLTAIPITLKYSQDGGTNWTQIATGELNDGSYTWRLPNVACLGTCKVAILASDVAGNINAPTDANTTSSGFSIIADNDAPVWDTGTILDISPKSIDGSGTIWTKTSANLSWNPGATDPQSGIAKYQIINDPAGTVKVDNVSGTSTTATFAEGVAETWYVKAINNADMSSDTKTVLGKTLTVKADGTAPVSTLTVAPMMGHGYTATNSNLVNLALGAITETGSGFKEAAFSNDGVLWSPYQATTSYTSWNLADVLTGGTTTRGTRTVYAKLKDQVGNESASISTTIMYEDTAPTNPTSVTAVLGSSTASTYSGGVWTGNTTVNVSWSGQADAAPTSSIHHFEVYQSKDDTGYNLLATVSASPYAVSGLVDGHNYKYLIKVYDNAGNSSNYLIGQTPGALDVTDITNPLTPPNFNAAGVDDTHISLSWNTSPENSSSHNGRAHTYTIDRTAGLGGTEPTTAGSAQTYTGTGTMTQTVSFEQSGAYSTADDKYTVSDTVTAQTWYYYRILATDAATQTSGYIYYKARGNFAPVLNQADITLSISSGHTTDTVTPGDTIIIGFKVSDPDGRTDIDFGTGNASQQLKIDNTVPANVLAYTEVTNKTADITNGYTYSYTYNVPTDAYYGTYAISINARDSVSVGNPGDNSHNLLRVVTFKIPPAAPGNPTASGYSSTQTQLNWTAPANAGLRATNTYEIERKLASGGTFAVVGTTTNTDYRDGGLVPNTAYVYRIRAFDISGNGGVYTADLSSVTPTPAIPSADTVELKDASTISSNAYRILLLWGDPVAASGTTTNEISAYSIWRSENAPDGPYIPLTGENAETTHHYIVDTGLSSATDYTYCIRSKDTFGNLSTNTDGTPLCQKVTGRPGATPTIYAVNATPRTSTAQITWKVNGQSTSSQVLYSLNSGELMDDTAAVNSAGVGGFVAADQTHTVEVKGLDPGKTYYYKVVTRNVLGVANAYGNVSELHTFTTNNFVIQHDSASTDLEAANGGVFTTTENAEVSWRTGNVASDSFVEYYIENAPGNSQIKGSGQIVAANGLHRILIPDLRANTTYVYYLKSKEENGQYTVTSPLYKLQTKAYDSSQFTIAPSASEVAEQNITATSAKIIWNTAITTIGCVEYDTAAIGTREKYPQTSCDAQYNTVHVIELMNLTPGETYFYRVTGTDMTDATYYSKEYSFSAILQPEILNLKATITSPYSAKITFNTNVDTDAVVSYGKNGDLSLKAGQTIMSREHEIILEDLEDGTPYTFFVEVKDRSNSIKKSGDNNFSTPIDTAGPAISGVKIELLPMGASDTTASVIISWQTDKPSTTKVEYTEGMIGNNYDKATVEDETLNNSHTVIIKELEPSITYRFRIVSKNKRGNESKSQDYNFVTPTQEKSIWQLIVKSLEETFSWVKNVGGFFKGQGSRNK